MYGYYVNTDRIVATIVKKKDQEISTTDRENHD